MQWRASLSVRRDRELHPIFCTHELFKFILYREYQNFRDLKCSGWYYSPWGNIIRPQNLKFRRKWIDLSACTFKPSSLNTIKKSSMFFNGSFPSLPKKQWSIHGSIILRRPSKFSERLESGFRNQCRPVEESLKIKSNWCSCHVF